MSKKHEKRTRAEILAKREQPIIEVPVMKKVGPALVPFAKKVRAASKYTPHFGKKEQERAKRCYMSPTFNYDGNLRAAPVIHQLCKVTQEAYLDARQQEYESVF